MVDADEIVALLLERTQERKITWQADANGVLIASMGRAIIRIFRGDTESRLTVNDGDGTLLIERVADRLFGSTPMLQKLADVAYDRAYLVTEKVEALADSLRKL